MDGTGLKVASAATVATLLFSLGLAGCSDESDAADPDVLTSDSSGPSAPATTPAAEQEDAVVAVVPRYFTAIERAYRQVDAGPLARLATDAWATEVVDGYRDNFVAQGDIMLGHATLVKGSAEVRIEGATATVEACIDNTNVFVVPKGTKGVGVGARGGIRMEETLTLELTDGAWLVDGLDSEGKQC